MSEKSIKRRRRNRPVSVRKPRLPYRESMNRFHIAAQTGVVWAILSVISIAWHTTNSMAQSNASAGVGTWMFMIQGALFCMYFLTFAIMARADIGWVITLSLIGMVFPFWVGIFLVIAGGMGATVVIPVGWLVLTMFAFTFSWRKQIAIAGVALVVFLLWSLSGILSTDRQSFILMREEQLASMGLVWHLLCSLVCVLGINERRRLFRKQWREYVRYRPTCPSCRYRFKGLPKSSERCPECGELIPFWVRDSAPQSNATRSRVSPDIQAGDPGAP